MGTLIAIAVITFLATFSLLIWETNNDHERALARKRHPTRMR